MNKVSVLSSGSWGSAVAKLLNENGHDVTLWSFKKEEAESIIQHRENKEFLPGVIFPENLKITYKPEEAIVDSEFIVCAAPSKFIRSTLNLFRPYFKENQIIINISKGLEDDTLLRLSEVIDDIAPMCKISTLSGPSHAEEVSRSIPTACVVASKDIIVSEKVQNLFMNNKFRVYVNEDLIGVELGGALKNVIALAAGISDGLGFGDNTKAALMTRGITEISRLGVAMGANVDTFSGLAGIGDLIVTCTSMHSRNRRAGILLGQGNTLSDTLDEIHMVVEGVNTAKAALSLARKYTVTMPITEEINLVLFNGKDPREAVVDLMTRDKTAEHI